MREALGVRYGIAGLHADYRSLLDAGGLDAIVVCSPAGTHAQVVLDALDAGIHVFVEKPMCITLDDADAIIAARDRAGKVVQVGTMKRYDPAVEAMIDNLPGDSSALRYVSVVVNDPEFDPYFEPGDIVRGSDVPRGADRRDAPRRGGAGRPGRRLGRRGRRASVQRELPRQHAARPERRARALERLGEPLPTEVVAGDWWNEGRAVYGALRLRERQPRRPVVDPVAADVRVPRADRLHVRRRGARAPFPVALAQAAPDRLPPQPPERPHDDVHIVNAYDESFARELEHFHGCIVEGTPCRTPPEAARSTSTS